jgi:hypothetical protein
MDSAKVSHTTELLPAPLPSAFLSSRSFRLAIAALFIITVIIVISTFFEESEIRQKKKETERHDYDSRRCKLLQSPPRANRVKSRWVGVAFEGL